MENNNHMDPVGTPLTDKEIESHIHDLLLDDPENFDAIKAYWKIAEDHYSDDLQEFTFREAVRCSAYNYVHSHYSDFDLNDLGDHSSYLYETDDSEMQDLLIDCGAWREQDDYSDYRFAIDTSEWTIIAFDSSLQKEAFEKYLEVNGLTREKIVQLLSDGYDESDDPDIPDDFEYHMEALGVSVDGNEITLRNMVYESNSEIMDLLEELGWDCEFEGSSWKFETLGVYYIE